MKIIARTLLATLAAALFSITATAATVEIGKPAPDFSATDILAGKTFKLSDYKGKTVVLEWVNPECPFVKKHYGSGNIPTLQKNATHDGVVWISINSAAPGHEGDYATADVTGWETAQNGAPSAYVRDSSGTIGKLYGAKTTPHIFVISNEGTLVYEGAIDSIRSTDKGDIAKATNYVTATLADLKNGTPVAKSSTAPYGCPVKY